MQVGCCWRLAYNSCTPKHTAECAVLHMQIGPVEFEGQLCKKWPCLCHGQPMSVSTQHVHELLHGNGLHCEAEWVHRANPPCQPAPARPSAPMWWQRLHSAPARC